MKDPLLLMITNCITVHLQIEEVSRRLRTGDLGIPPNPEERFGHVHNPLSFHAGQLKYNLVTRVKGDGTHRSDC